MLFSCRSSNDLTDVVLDRGLVDVQCTADTKHPGDFFVGFNLGYQFQRLMLAWGQRRLVFCFVVGFSTPCQISRNEIYYAHARHLPESTTSILEKTSRQQKPAFPLVQDDE